MRSGKKRKSPVVRFASLMGLSLVLHVLLLASLSPLWPYITAMKPAFDARPISLVVLPPEVETPEEEEPPIPDGQIVDIAKPLEPERPEEADYLAYDQKVEKETRTERYRINPEVLAPTYSRDDKVEFEDLIDLDVTEPSTGAQVGADKFDPSRDGSMASIQSRFTLTNRDGLQKPVPASHRSQELSGAPNNDRLDVEIGEAVNLNAKDFLFRDYYNRIRRLVNFYWNQNLDNLPQSVVLAKPSYTTRVYVILDGRGSLESIDIERSSGIGPLDNAVVDAFKIAGPFPNPPEQLIGKDGRVNLGNMEFEVNVGHARAPYMGVDPRAGVQFPGILKAQ